MDDLDLHTSTNTPGINNGHIDQNWLDIQERVNHLLASDATGGRRIVSIEADGGMMTMTLSDGTVLGPIPLPRVPLSLKGDWQPGMPYQIGDVVSHDNGSIGCKIAHVSGADLEDDLDAQYWQWIAKGGSGGSGGAGGLRRHSFMEMEPAVSYTKLIGAIYITEPCSLQTAHPFKGSLLTPYAAGGAAPLKYRLEKRGFESGTTQLLGMLEFPSSNVREDNHQALAVDAALMPGDMIRLWQEPMSSPPSAGQLVAELTLVPAG